MAKHMQFNESFTEAQILSLTAIPERNVSDVYKASDTGNVFEVLEDLTVTAYSRVSEADFNQEITDRAVADNALASQIVANDADISALQTALSALSVTVTKEPEYEHHSVFGEDSGNSGNGFLFSYGNGDTGAIGFRVPDNSELIGIGFQADNGGTGDGLDVEVVDIRDVAAITTIHTHNVSGVGDGQNNNTHTYEDLRSAPVSIPNGSVVALRIANEFGAYNSYRVKYEYRTPTGRQLVTEVTL